VIEKDHVNVNNGHKSLESRVESRESRIAERRYVCRGGPPCPPLFRSSRDVTPSRLQDRQNASCADTGANLHRYPWARADTATDHYQYAWARADTEVRPYRCPIQTIRHPPPTAYSPLPTVHVTAGSRREIVPLSASIFAIAPTGTQNRFLICPIMAPE